MSRPDRYGAALSMCRYGPGKTSFHTPSAVMKIRKTTMTIAANMSGGFFTAAASPGVRGAGHLACHCALPADVEVAWQEGEAA